MKEGKDEPESSEKEKIDKFRLAEEVVTKQGNRVVKLYHLKQEAIENEDYMTAKKIKDQISSIEL